MARKPLGLDREGIQKVMHGRDYLTDSLGQFGLNAITNMVGQLTYFYTDKVGLAAGAVATIMLICKLIDACTDLIMGNIVDHTKPGKEKYRPWLLKAGIPASIVLVLMFCVPKTTNWAQLAFVLVTNVLLTAVFFTAIAIPYTSLMVVRTKSQEERAKMGTWRAAVGYASGTIIGIALIPVTNMLGGTQSAWIKFAAILAMLVAICFGVCYIFSKESAIDTASATIEKKEEEEEDKALPFRETIKNLFHNKYWVIILVLNFLACIIYGVIGGSGVYYCKWIFGDDNLVAVLGVVMLIPTVIGFAIVNPLTKRFGAVNTLKIGFAIGVIANVIRVINPYHFILNVVMWGFSTLATMPMMCLLGVVMSMSIDYNEYLFGTRMVASSNSASGFGSKVGSGIGGSVIGWCLALAHYDATLAVAPAATKIAIFTFSIYVPLAMFAVMYILCCLFDLEKKLPEIRRQLAERNAAKENT